MPEHFRISLRIFTKSIVDTIRRFRLGSAGEIRSIRKEQDRSALGVLDSPPGTFKKRGGLILVSNSELALLFLPQPFFTGPDRDLCPRGKA